MSSAGAGSKPCMYMSCDVEIIGYCLWRKRKTFKFSLFSSN